MLHCFHYFHIITDIHVYINPQYYLKNLGLGDERERFCQSFWVVWNFQIRHYVLTDCFLEVDCPKCKQIYNSNDSDDTDYDDIGSAICQLVSYSTNYHRIEAILLFILYTGLNWAIYNRQIYDRTQLLNNRACVYSFGCFKNHNIYSIFMIVPLMLTTNICINIIVGWLPGHGCIDIICWVWE